MDNVILEVDNLGKYFPVTRGFWKEIVGHVKAVDKVSFYVEEGETLGLVGESGCGKTTLGRCILRLIEPTEGKVWFKKNDGSKVELTKLQLKEFKEFRKEIRMIFQDPDLSLDPKADSNGNCRRTHEDSSHGKRQRLRRQGKKIARNGRPESSIYEEISS